MCDFFDDFDDFGENGFKEDDSFEDSFDEDLGMDEPFTGDTEPNDEPDKTESKDDFTAKDAFIVGGAFGWGYEEGLREQKRRKRKRFSDDADQALIEAI